MLKKNNPDTETYIKIAEWLDIYHSSQEVTEREKVKTLIVTNMYPVIKYIARTIARRAYDPIDDLVQAGFIGLLKAIDRYDKEKNDNFRVYAGYLIIGEMKHYLRDKLNTIRVPRYIQELSIRIHNFIKDLTPEEVENLTSDDVALALDVSTRSVDFAMQVDRRRSTLSLEELYHLGDKNLYYEELLAEKNYKERTEYEDARIIFQDAIGKLSAEDKIFIEMYYNQDMNKKEIADAMLLTQMNVTRRMRQAFNNIAELVVEDYQSKQEDIGNS